MEDCVKSFYDPSKDIWGYPQIYKETSFYPILLKDIEAQTLFYSVFQFPKDYIVEKQVIKMSYLIYLLIIIQYNIDPKGNQIKEKLIKLIQHITRTKEVEFDIAIPKNYNGKLDAVSANLKIGHVYFNEQEFDAVREIILLQNGLSTRFVEEFNPELEEHLKYSNTDLGEVTFEEELFTFASMMNKTILEIGEMSLYQFKKQLDRLMLLSDYHFYGPLETSGQIKDKNGGKITRHYFSHQPLRSRYSSILIDTEEFLQRNPETPDANGKIRLK